MIRNIPVKIQIDTEEHVGLFEDIVDSFMQDRQLNDFVLACILYYHRNPDIREEILEIMKEIGPIRYAKKESRNIERANNFNRTETEYLKSELINNIEKFKKPIVREKHEEQPALEGKTLDND